MAKLEPLFLPSRARCLIIDSDVVFLGPVLDELERHDEDFIVVNESHPIESIRRNYFNEQTVQRLYPSFQFPGYVFNTGQIVTNTGIFAREDFAPFVSFTEPRQPLQPDLFLCGEQGFLNYIVLSKIQDGSLTLRRQHFMKWAAAMNSKDVNTDVLTILSPYKFMVHWAGPKSESLSANPMNHLLEYFEGEYYRRIKAKQASWSLSEIRGWAAEMWKHVRSRSTR